MDEERLSRSDSSSATPEAKAHRPESPVPPPTECAADVPIRSAQLAAKIPHWLALRQQTGLSFNARLLATHGLHDPCCAEHLLAYIDIDPSSTNIELDDSQAILEDVQVEGWDYAKTARRQREAWEAANPAYNSSDKPALQMMPSKTARR